MFDVVHVAVLVEDQRNASRMASIRIAQGRRRVQFVFGAFEHDRAVRQSDGHSTGVAEILFVIIYRLATSPVKNK